MPTASLRPCATPRCPSLVRGGHCPEHARVKERQRPNLEMRKLYYTPQWQALRQQVIQEQPWCDDCLNEENRLVPGVEVDHTVPHRVAPERFFDRSNLTNKCKRHHSMKTRRGE